MARKKPTLESTIQPSLKSAEPPASANGPANPKVLTLSEAAAYLRVSSADVLQMVTTQGLPGRKIGEEWRFYKGALHSWLGEAPKKQGLMSQIGALKDDPHLEEMLKEIYKRRGRPETEEG